VRRIVYVGAVSEARGSVVTLKAIRILQDRGIEVEFDCVGRASAVHARYLEKLVSEWSLTGVRFHGYKIPTDAWRIASGAAAGLAILQPEPNYVESYPTKVFEYMALKLPVIVSDFPLYREVIQTADCGLCVSPGDPAALADAVQEILRDPARASRLGENGRHAVINKYHWESQLDTLETFYRAQLLS
jgi:glycosyltransferase involved in cell wall biosynthesis